MTRVVSLLTDMHDRSVWAASSATFDSKNVVLVVRITETSSLEVMDAEMKLYLSTRDELRANKWGGMRIGSCHVEISSESVESLRQVSTLTK